jgi:hypothetical protein
VGSWHDEQMTEAETSQENTGSEIEQATPTVPTNKAFTIPSSRLSASPACLNCGTELLGPFCFYCGQPDKNLMRFFPALLREILEDVIDFDSRFMRTLKPLLFHPGKITRDYLDGRRFRYVPPMRLYIFSSMAFFILAAMMASQNIVINSDEPGVGLHIETGTEGGTLDEQLQQAVELGKMSEEDARIVVESIAKARSETGGLSELTSGEDGCNGEDVICFGEEPWDLETNPLIVPGMPDFVNSWINNEIEGSPQKGRESEANPNLIVDKMFDVLPITVFIMLPLVAMLFKFWYLFANKYYVEHLIHALHNHSFLFVVFILAAFADAVSSSFFLSSSSIMETALSWLSAIILCWIPIYLLISLKTVYRQNWTMTLIKFSLIGISYLVLLVIVTALAAVLSFVLL